MVKKISLIIIVMLFSITSLFASFLSKLSFETQFGTSNDTINYVITKDTTDRIEVKLESFSIGEKINYDLDDGLSFVTVGTFRINNEFKFKTKFFPDDFIYTEKEAFQNSFNLFVGIEKEYFANDKISFSLGSGINSLFIFDNKSDRYYPITDLGISVDTVDSTIYSFGIGGFMNLDYKIVNNLKVSFALNSFYNSIVLGDVYNRIKTLSESDNSKFNASLYSITSTFGIVYSL